MSSRIPGRVLRLALVCMAVLSLRGGAAHAAAPDSETPTTSPAPDASVQAAEDSAEPRQAPAKDWLSTAMNAGAVGFCVWMLALLWRPGLGRSLRASRPGPPSDS